MPTRSLVQPSLKHIDFRWHLLEWLKKNASEQYITFDTIYRHYPHSQKWYDLLNEVAFLCHQRQVSFKVTGNKNRYKFQSLRSNPIMPLITQPFMTVDDYLCAVQPSYINSEDQYDNISDVISLDIVSDDDDDDSQKLNLSRYAHAFCVDHRPCGEPVWLKFL